MDRDAPGGATMGVQQFLFWNDILMCAASRRDVVDMDVPVNEKSLRQTEVLSGRVWDWLVFAWRFFRGWIEAGRGGTPLTQDSG